MPEAPLWSSNYGRMYLVANKLLVGRIGSQTRVKGQGFSAKWCVVLGALHTTVSDTAIDKVGMSKELAERYLFHVFVGTVMHLGASIAWCTSWLLCCVFLIICNLYVIFGASPH